MLNGGQIPSGGLDNFSSGFLPAAFQGSLLNAIGNPLANIRRQEQREEQQAVKREFARQLNARSLARAGTPDALESAIRNFELAARCRRRFPP